MMANRQRCGVTPYSDLRIRLKKDPQPEHLITKVCQGRKQMEALKKKDAGYLDPHRESAGMDLEVLKTTHTDTEQVILKRRSTRAFKKKQVPEFMVRRILEAGRFAPSAGNCQPWKFIVVRDPELIQGLTETTVKTCKRFKRLMDYRWTTSLWRRLFANLNIRLMPNDLHPTPFGAISLIADGRLSLYHGAPTVVIILKDVRGVGSPDLDCGIAGQNMVLTAHSMGLGTCWVSFAKLAFKKKEWRRKFGITYPYAFVSSLAVGWPVGHPDGMVPRPKHEIDWYENARKQVTS